MWAHSTQTLSFTSRLRPSPHCHPNQCTSQSTSSSRVPLSPKEPFSPECPIPLQRARSWKVPHQIWVLHFLRVPHTLDSPVSCGIPSSQSTSSPIGPYTSSMPHPPREFHFPRVTHPARMTHLPNKAPFPHTEANFPKRSILAENPIPLECPIYPRESHLSKFPFPPREPRGIQWARAIPCWIPKLVWWIWYEISMWIDAGTVMCRNLRLHEYGTKYSYTTSMVSAHITGGKHHAQPKWFKYLRMSQTKIHKERTTNILVSKSVKKS